MSKNVVIVGGGLAGLAASIYLARAGRTVTVFEKRQALGGRAITQLRQGFRFNLGAHAFYRSGPGASVLRELGVPVRGARPKPRGIALVGGEERRLPTGIPSLLISGLLSIGAKLELASAFWRIRRIDRHPPPDSMSVREWIDANVSSANARSVLMSLVRLMTYSAHENASAALSLRQVKVGLRGAIYVDEGWQRIVDSLHSTAISSGVNFVTSSRIVGVESNDGKVTAIHLGGLELDADRMDTLAIAYPADAPERVDGARVPAQTVILAVDPATASELANEPSWSSARPVTAACLDVALRSLPQPKRTFALGIDEPFYFAVHSQWAQLTPKGGALIHTVKYRREQKATDVEMDGERARRDGIAATDERELEGLLDRMQPGWRDVLVHRRFLPSMTVTNALATPNAPRPSAITNVRGLYIAGDWVGNEGLLSDAALASARAAAKAILAD